MTVPDGEAPVGGGPALPRAASDWVLPDLRWTERHGTSFDWTLADHRVFVRDYEAYLRRRRPRRAWARVARWTGGLSFGVIVLAAFVAGLILARQFYADPASDVVAGAMLGAGSTLVAMALLGIALARVGHLTDRAWTFGTMRVGVEGEMLWISKRAILGFYAPSALVDVVRTDRLILAFVNRVTAHAFPRDRLAADEEGRIVIAWFDAHWPVQPGAGASSGGGRPVYRRGWRTWRDAAVILATLYSTWALFNFWVSSR